MAVKTELVTGKGTAENPYVIGKSTDDADVDIMDVWDTMREYIKKDKVHVKMAKDYTFDLDDMFRESQLPSDGMPIGYDTELDGAGSELKSLSIKAETFDFEGKSAVVKDFVLLRYKLSGPDNYLVIVDSVAKWIDQLGKTHDKTEKSLNKIKGYYERLNGSASDNNIKDMGRLKCVPKLVKDYSDTDEFFQLHLASGSNEKHAFRVLQCEDLTLKNHGNLQINFYGPNTTYNKDSYQQDVYFEISAIYNLNIVDCMTQDNSSLYANHAYFFECRFILYNFVFNRHFIDVSKVLNNNTNIFIRCDIELHGSENGATAFHGTNRNFYKLFKDCVVFLDKIKMNNEDSLDPAFINSYIYGDVYCSITSSSSSFDTGQGHKNTIAELNILPKERKVSFYSNRHNYPCYGLVFKKDEDRNNGSYDLGSSGKNYGTFFLTSEEIRNPQKLYDAGISIDPSGSSG